MADNESVAASSHEPQDDPLNDLSNEEIQQQLEEILWVTYA